MTGPSIKCYDDLAFLPEEFKFYNNELFLQFETKTKNNEYIQVYGMQSGLALLKNSPLWTIDGTRKKCPQPFSQIYVIGVIDSEHCLPALYCLLPNHSTECYEIVFNFITEKLEIFVLQMS